MYWKVCCFQDQVFGHMRNLGSFPEIVVSIGDGSYERDACRHLAAHLKTLSSTCISNAGAANVKFVSLKLIELPSPAMLTQELQLLAAALPGLNPRFVAKARAGTAVGSASGLVVALIGLMEDARLQRVPECFHGSDCVCKAAEITPPITPPDSPAASGPACASACAETGAAAALACLVGRGHTDLRVQSDPTPVLSSGRVEMEFRLAPFDKPAI
jgi:hypothetical protein